MNKLEKWLLRKLIDKAIRGRLTHKLMEYVWAAARYRFYEDNIPTRYEFLREKLHEEMEVELNEMEALYGKARSNPR